MVGSWDDWDALHSNDEIETIAIELVVIFSAIAILVVLLYLKKKYPKMTEKGFGMMILGFGIFAGHTLFDFLDTLAVKEVEEVKTVLYLFLDFADAIMSFVGLILVGIAFLQIANYGMQVWKEEKRLMIFLKFTEVHIADAILEGLTPIAYIFVLFMVIEAKRRNKIFASKSFPLLILAVGLGTVAGGMDLFNEFFWIENNYEIYKFFMEFTKITGLLLFAIALLMVFRFQKFLMGEE